MLSVVGRQDNLQDSSLHHDVPDVVNSLLSDHLMMCLVKGCESILQTLSEVPHSCLQKETLGMIQWDPWTFWCCRCIAALLAGVGGLPESTRSPRFFCLSLFCVKIIKKNEISCTFESFLTRSKFSKKKKQEVLCFSC